MKKKNDIWTVLGITQQELAMLLRVNRSQLAMYKTGKRELPMAAMILLAEIFSYVQSPEAVAQRSQAVHTYSARQLQLLSRENEYQQMIIAKKRADATKKYEAQAGLLRLSEFVKSREDAKKGTIGFPGILALKTFRAVNAPLSPVIAELEHRMELLGLEKGLLESKLVKVR